MINFVILSIDFMRFFFLFLQSICDGWDRLGQLAMERRQSLEVRYYKRELYSLNPARDNEFFVVLCNVRLI